MLRAPQRVAEHGRLTMMSRYSLKINSNLMNNVRIRQSLKMRGAKFTKQSRFASVLVTRANVVFDSA
jgi:hypothetical protein